MDIITLILLLAAFICFLAAAFNARVRINLMALGLAFWVLVPLLNSLQGHVH